MNIDKANTFLFYNLVKETLAYADNPGELGLYLTSNIRELTGCKAVIIYYQKQNNLKVLDVCPTRKKDLALSSDMQYFSRTCQILSRASIINTNEKNEKIKEAFLKLKVNESIYIPLNIGLEKIGTLIIHDLLTNIGNNAVLKALGDFGGVIALALKNALLFQNLEEKVEERTKQLKLKNEEYLALNEEYEVQNMDLAIAKEKAEESERKFKNTFNISPAIISKANIKTGYFTEVNEAIPKILGFSIQEFMSKPILELIHPDDIKKTNTEILEQLSGKEVASFENRYLCKDGSYKWIAWYGTPANNHGIVTAIGTDVDAQKKAEIEIKQQKKLFETMFNTLEEGVVITDTKRNILLANKGMFNTFGYENNELIGENTKKLYADENLYIDTGKNVFDKTANNTNQYLTYYKTKHKRVFPGETFGAKLTDINGEWIGNIGIMRDVTEKENYIKELKAAKEKAEESDRLKTTFLQNMSHEIRTPMNGILGFSDMLNKPDLSPSKRNSFVEIIQSSSHQLLRIIDDILEISKLGTNQVKVDEKLVCINDLILELFSIFYIKAKEKEVPLYIELTLSDEKSKILTDESKLRKILSNLIENAVKYTSRGSIEIGCTLNTDEKLPHLEISVKDTGIGISTEYLESIFERFSQEEKPISRNLGGLGLGLSIVKENTELIGGKVTLQSKKGSGSTFMISLPYKSIAVDENAHVANSNKDEALKKKRLRTFMVAEDEEINYLFIKTLFEENIEQNCKLIHAKNGKEAIEIFKLNPDVELILMDIKMPIMNGLEATKQIRALNQNVPIIAQTAYSSSDDRDTALLAGCSNFITKPINITQFCDLIQSYIQNL